MNQHVDYVIHSLHVFVFIGFVISSSRVGTFVLLAFISVQACLWQHASPLSVKGVLSESDCVVHCTVALVPLLEQSSTVDITNVQRIILGHETLDLFFILMYFTVTLYTPVQFKFWKLSPDRLLTIIKTVWNNSTQHQVNAFESISVVAFSRVKVLQTDIHIISIIKAYWLHCFEQRPLGFR